METFLFIVLFSVVLLVSGFVGAFGFPQIIGCIKYRPRGSALTIIVWIPILVFAGYAVHKWIPQYAIAYYMGTAFSLLASFSVKPD